MLKSTATIFSVAILLAFLVLATAREHYRWYAIHDYDQDGYQAEFDYVTSLGYRPTYVSGYSENNSPRYAAVFEQSPSSGWVARHGLTADQFQSEFDAQGAAGFRLTLVSGYYVGGQILYVALWDNNPGPAYIARHGLTAEQYQQEFDAQASVGYRPVHVSGYHDGSQALYAAIWHQDNSVGWIARHGLTAADYQHEFDTHGRNGYHLKQVSGYSVGGTDYFAAIWENGPWDPWLATHGLNSTQYISTAYGDFRYQMYQPIMQCGYGGENGPPRFAAVWVNQYYTAENLSHIDSVVLAKMNQTGVPSISIAISKEEQLVFAKAYGYADVANNVPANSHSRYRIASVSKPITAAAIMKLVEGGFFTLDSTVFGPNGIFGNKYGTVRPYLTNVEKITIRHLLSHTAGGWTNDGNDPMFSNPTLNHDDLITWTIDNRPLVNVPGAAYAYSNFGYSVLGRVIEYVSGLSYDTYVQHHFLIPSGISTMTIAGDTRVDRQPDEVLYYDPNPEAPYQMKVTRMDSHGGWLASAVDLVRYGVHVDGRANVTDLLSNDTLVQMTTGSTANSGYGLGLAVNSLNNWWHDGSLPGSRAIYVRTGTGFVWAALANSRANNIDLDPMMWDVIRGIVWPNSDLF